MDFAITRINSDPEVNRRVWLQLTRFKGAIQIPEKRKDELFAWAIDLTKKLMSVKYHRDNLLRILNEEFEKGSKATETTNVTVVDVSTGAERELEAFLMQGKSSLDVLVKIFVPIFGIKIHTYGDGGIAWQHALDFIKGINDGTYIDCGAGYSDWRLTT